MRITFRAKPSVTLGLFGTLLALATSGGCEQKKRDWQSGDTGGVAGSPSSAGEPGNSSSGGQPPQMSGEPSGGNAGAGSESPQDLCTTDDECASGKCRISFRDLDGDGYGNDADAVGRCDGTVPEGYSSVGGDCCDDGGNLELAALIHPGQTEYFDAPANICGISWDYNCNGRVDFGGYTCPTSNDACADPAQRDYDSPQATSDGRVVGCTHEGLACDGECMATVEPLTEADCASSFPPDSCRCLKLAGQDQSTCIFGMALGVVRVVQCH